MSRKVLTGRTEILAAIYNPEHLPSASLLPNSSSPFCLHGLRANGLEFFENTFMPSLRVGNGINSDNSKKDEELECSFFPFFEEAPYVNSFTCTGCYHGMETEGHSVKDSEHTCTKTCEECA